METVLSNVEMHELGLGVRVDTHANPWHRPQIGRQSRGHHVRQPEIDGPTLCMHALVLTDCLSISRDYLDVVSSKMVRRPKYQLQKAPIHRVCLNVVWVVRVAQE